MVHRQGQDLQDQPKTEYESHVTVENGFVFLASRKQSQVVTASNPAPVQRQSKFSWGEEGWANVPDRYSKRATRLEIQLVPF